MNAMQQFQKVTMRFTPKRLDDLHPDAPLFIEEGPYAGLWAMKVPREWDVRMKTDGFVWTPECDLSAVPAAHSN